MHKELMILGLVQRQPVHGYDLFRVIRLHGTLFAELKKANLYYLLARMERQGYITADAERPARGARGERVRYTITEAGRAQFITLLRESALDYSTNAVSTALVFISSLPHSEAVSLLKQRSHRIAKRLEEFEEEVGDLQEHAPLPQLATTRMLEHILVEQDWTRSTIERIKTMHWQTPTLR
jgi:DNA-binding PadR family transcriptional regulator